MLAFSTACRGMAMAVVAAALRGLGLDTAEALAVCAGRNCTLRLLHCAPIPADFQISGEDGKSIPPEPDGRRVITRRHVDTGLLSVLWQDGRGGLQVQGRDEVWREVPPRSDAFSVHCGDLLAGLSAGALRATPHRVLGLGEERHAIGFFLEPDFTREVLPPDSDRPKAYAAHLIDEFPARFAAS
jgi:isopenicillin N synthase-like dioxygenase